MAPFDDLLKAGLGNMSGGDQQHPGNSLATGVLEMLSSQQGGGLQGMMQNFAQNGLGHLMASWVGTGQNLPVSGAQIQSVLGSDAVRSLAQRAGIAPETANSLLAQILPSIVDKLTPNGTVPESGNLLEQGANILRGLKF